jgi:ABC-2 type transport system permease protein
VIRRILTVIHARNLEFLRDRGRLVATVLLPFVLLAGLGFALGGPQRPLFKVGVLTEHIDPATHPFLRERYLQFIAVGQRDQALRDLTHQQIDLLVDLRGQPRYWVNDDSPKGYICEKMFLASAPGALRQSVSGAAVRYIDWLFPGVLAMNMMFSCLFGISAGVLRYRKTGLLKRLYATPLTALEFLIAQVASRLMLVLALSAILYFGVGYIIHFHSAGSLVLLSLVATLGAISMIALGLPAAAYFSSDELVQTILNLLAWPMMLLSGVWFTLEGSPHWMQWVAHCFPLTYMLDAARAVMLDGARFPQIAPDLLFLASTAISFLVLGAWSFRWRFD